MGFRSRKRRQKMDKAVGEAAKAVDSAKKAVNAPRPPAAGRPPMESRLEEGGRTAPKPEREGSEAAADDFMSEDEAAGARFGSPSAPRRSPAISSEEILRIGTEKTELAHIGKKPVGEGGELMGVTEEDESEDEGTKAEVPKEVIDRNAATRNIRRNNRTEEKEPVKLPFKPITKNPFPVQETRNSAPAQKEDEKPPEQTQKASRSWAGEITFALFAGSSLATAALLAKEFLGKSHLIGVAIAAVAFTAVMLYHVIEKRSG